MWVLSVMEVLSAWFGYGEEEFLTKNQMIAVIAVAGVIALAVAIGLALRSRKVPKEPDMEACHECGSMNVQNRAGLAVCMDCGYSVRLTEVEVV